MGIITTAIKERPKAVEMTAIPAFGITDLLLDALIQI
jgi:hypothetical protein